MRWGRGGKREVGSHLPPRERKEEIETERHNQRQSEGLIFAEKQRPERNEREGRQKKEGKQR